MFIFLSGYKIGLNIKTDQENLDVVSSLKTCEGEREGGGHNVQCSKSVEFNLVI